MTEVFYKAHPETSAATSALNNKPVENVFQSPTDGFFRFLNSTKFTAITTINLTVCVNGQNLINIEKVWTHLWRWIRCCKKDPGKILSNTLNSLKLFQLLHKTNKYATTTIASREIHSDRDASEPVCLSSSHDVHCNSRDGGLATSIMCSHCLLCWGRCYSQIHHWQVSCKQQYQWRLWYYLNMV